MTLFIGNQEISGIYVGGSLASAVYVGDLKVWPTGVEPPAEVFDWVDDFERSSIGSDWTGSGGVIAGTAPNRHLKKSASTGSADYWTTQQFSSDDLIVETVLGPVTDAQQKAAIMLGSTAQNIYVEFSQQTGIIGAYNGTSWTTLNNFGAISWAEGDVIRVERIGTAIRLYRNSALIASATSSVARGTAHRRVALSVKANTVFVVTFYGPTFDKVSIRAD